MSELPRHSVSVAGVTVDDQGHVLVIKRRDNGQWQVPGGVLEIHESFEVGVAREVFEETGFRVEVKSLTGVYKNVAKGVVALVYRCSLLSGTPTVSDEASEVAWLESDEAIARMNPTFAIRVEDALVASQCPASRTHDGAKLL